MLTNPTSSLIWCYGSAAPIYSLGPGPRVGLWVTGCSRACHGCMTPHLQSLSAGWAVPIADVVWHVINKHTECVGLTLSGGEPFEQADSLAALLVLLKSYRPNWDVIAYSGYYYQQLKGRLAYQALLAEIDLLIDGPFAIDLPPIYPLTGSGNQSIVALTSHGQHLRTQIITQPMPSGELAYDQNADSFWIGLPTTAFAGSATIPILGCGGGVPSSPVNVAKGHQLPPIVVYNRDG